MYPICRYAHSSETVGELRFINPAWGGKDRIYLRISSVALGSTPYIEDFYVWVIWPKQTWAGGVTLQIWSETVDRAQKEQLVEDLGQIFESSGVVVVSHYEGLTVAEMQDLRARAREAGGSVRVAKNKLAKIALEGKPCESIGEFLTGMTVLTFSEDPVAAAKVAQGFAKDNDKLVILGGAMGETALDPAGVKAVSEMPSREELIASIAGCIGAPASNIAGAIGAPASNIASVLSTIEEKAA